jgi:predicted nucleotidyltransferase
MTKDELSSKIEDLTRQLIAKYSPEKIILFGSAAGDRGEEVNDVDLFIIKNDVPHLGAERMRHLYRLMDTTLPVDYFVYRSEEVANRLALGDPFITEIISRGKVLYG